MEANIKVTLSGLQGIDITDLLAHAFVRAHEQDFIRQLSLALATSSQVPGTTQKPTSASSRSTSPRLDQTNGRKWAVACYMAGDNSLSSSVKHDLDQLADGVKRSQGRISSVSLLVDSSSEDTHEYSLSADGNLRLVKRYENTNSGDPDVLRRFLTDSLRSDCLNAAILWGHGNGWRDFGRGSKARNGLFDPQKSTYRFAQRLLDAPRLVSPVSLLTPSHVPLDVLASFDGIRTSDDKNAVIAKLADRLLGRMYGIDDATGDFLDIFEFSNVLEQQTTRLGRKLDLVMFDACLMANLEVVVQLAPFTRLYIGSVEKVPSFGMPYQYVLEILGACTHDDTFDTQRFGHDLVEAYCREYLPHGSQFRDSQMVIGGGRSPDTPVTLSCIDTDKVDGFITSVLSPCITLLAHVASQAQGRAALAAALLQCPGYGSGKDYIGLLDLFESFTTQANNLGIDLPSDFVAASSDLSAALAAADASSLFLGKASISDAAGRSCPDWYPFSKDRSGITFYFPRSSSPELFVVWQRLRVASLLSAKDYAAVIGQ